MATSPNPGLTRAKRFTLGQEGIALLPSAPVEIDHLSLEDQAALFTDFEHLTGVRLGILVLSGDLRPESLRAAGVEPAVADGGKSIHAYPLFQRPLDPTPGTPDRKLWDRIVRYQIAVFGGDTKIANAGHLMRTPGVIARTPWRTGNRLRVQTCLRADNDAALPAEDYLAALETYARHIGLATDEDVERCVEANKLAERCEQRIRSEKVPTEWEEECELADLAASFRDRRVVDPKDAELAHLLLGLHIQASHETTERPSGGSTTSLSTRRGSGGAPTSGKPQEVPTDIPIAALHGGQSEERTLQGWAASGDIPESGLRVQCPHCQTLGILDPRGATMRPGAGRPAITCWRDPTHRSRMASVPMDLAGIELLNIHSGAPPLALVQEEDVVEPPGEEEGGKTLEVHQRYLEIPPELWAGASLVTVRSGVGTGKTTEIARMCGQDPLLLITHRRSLARSLARGFNAVNYETLRKADWHNLPDRLVVCVDSVPKLMKGLINFGDDGEPILRKYTVVIDESEQVFRHLHGDTLRRKHLSGRVWECLSMVLTDYADRIVMADAHLSDYSSQVLGLLMAPRGLPPAFHTIPSTTLCRAGP